MNFAMYRVPGINDPANNFYSASIPYDTHWVIGSAIMEDKYKDLYKTFVYDNTRYSIFSYMKFEKLVEVLARKNIISDIVVSPEEVDMIIDITYGGWDNAAASILSEAYPFIINGIKIIPCN